MKYISILSILFLTSCSGVNSEIITSTKHTVILPPDNMYSCQVVDKFPDVNNLSDLQVAKLIVQLHSNNIECQNSILAIKKFLEDAKKTVENEQSE